MLPLKKKTQERKTAHAPTQSEENRKTRSGIVSHGASQCTESTRSTVRVKGGKSVWQTAPPTLSAPPPTSLPLSYGFNYEGMRVRGPRHTCSATWRHPPYLRAFLTYINTQRGGSEEGGCWTKECKRVLGPRELQSRAARSPPTVSSAPAEPQAVTPPPQHLSLYSFKLDLNNF